MLGVDVFWWILAGEAVCVVLTAMALCIKPSKPTSGGWIRGSQSD